MVNNDPKLIDVLLEKAQNKDYRTEIELQPESGAGGNTGFQPLNKWDDGLLRGMNQNEQRAIAQPNFKALMNSVVQIGSTIVGDAIAGVGYLGELKDINDIASGTETEWGNWLTRSGEWIKSKGEDIAPIYASEAAMNSFAPWDGEWWAANIPSIGSTLALMAPAVGVAGLVSRAGKAAKISAEVMKGVSGLTAALTSRHIENMMESKEVFDNSFRLALDKGKTDEEAKLVAARAASDSYKMNYVNLITDIPQYLGLLGVRLPKGSGKVVSGAAQRVGSAVKGVVSEGAEEATQFVIQKEAERGAKIELGDDDGTTFGQRLVEYLKDPGLQTAAFFGGLGGAVFGALGETVDQAEKSPEEARNDSLKKVTDSAIESGDFEKPKQMVNGLKTDQDVTQLDPVKTTENLQQADDLIDHTKAVYNALVNDPNQVEKTKLSRDAKLAEQKLAFNERTLQGIKSSIKDQDQFDYNFLNKQLDRLSGKNTTEATKIKEEIKSELKDPRFEELTAKPIDQFSPYNTLLNTLTAERVNAKLEQAKAADTLQKYETPEGQEQLVKEAKKEQKAQEKAVVEQAQKAKTPIQVEQAKVDNPQLSEKLDEVVETKANEEQKEAPSNPDDYETIDDFVEARYGDNKFLLAEDLKKFGFENIDQIKKYLQDKKDGVEATTEDQPTQAPIADEKAEIERKRKGALDNIVDTGVRDEASGNGWFTSEFEGGTFSGTTRVDIEDQINEKYNNELSGKVENTDNEGSLFDTLADQLDKESAAKSTKNKAKPETVIVEHNDRSDAKGDSSTTEAIESDDVNLGITNDFALYKVKGEWVEYSGIGTQGNKVPFDLAKKRYKVRKSATKWTTLQYAIDIDENTKKHDPVKSEWRQADFDYDDLHTIYTVPNLIGRAVYYEVDTTNVQAFDYNGWKSLRILARLRLESGQVKTIAMVKTYNNSINDPGGKLASFREDLYNKWAAQGKPKTFQYDQTGVLEDVYAGRFWNTGERNNPEAVLGDKETLEFAVGVGQGSSGVQYSTGARNVLNVVHSTNQPESGAVYQALITANGRKTWSRLFTKKLKDENVKAKEGQFPFHEKFIGFTGQSLKQTVIDLLNIAVTNPEEFKKNWVEIRQEVQSIVKYTELDSSGNTKYGPDFGKNLPEYLLKNKMNAIDFYNSLKLDDRIMQIDANRINSEGYNQSVSDRLETDINPFVHTHSPKFKFSFPEVGEVVKPDQTTQTEDQLDGYYDIIDDDVMFKNAPDVYYELWDEAKEIDWFKTRFPNIPIQVFEALKAQGKKKHGAFHQASGVLLSKTAVAGTTYHEAFHVAFLLGLNEKQQANLLEQAKKLYGDKTAKELEENLADAFMEYVQTQTAPANRIFRFFKMLYDRIVFSLTNKLSIDYMFDCIQSGKFSNVKLGKQFETRNKLIPEFENLREQRLRVKESLHYFDVIVGAIRRIEGVSLKEAYKIATKNPEIFRGDGHRGIPSIRMLFEQAQSRVKPTKERDAQFQRVYDGLKSGNLVNQITDKLASRGIYVTNATANEEDTKVFEDEETFLESWQKKSMQISPLENMTGELKRFLDNVPRQTRNSKGETVPVVSYLGIPQFHDGKFLYADLQSRIGGSINSDDMLNKLRSVGSPHYDWIYKAVANSSDLRTDLFKVAQKVHPVFKDIVLDKPTGRYNIKVSNVDSINNKILSEWFTSFSDYKYNEYLNKDGEVINKTKLDANWKKVYDKINAGQNPVDEFIELAHSIGLVIEPTVVNDIVVAGEFKNVAAAFNSFITAFKNNDITFENQPIKNLVSQIAPFYPITYQSAHINVEGNREYEWINSSYVGRTISAMNSGQYDWSMFEKDIYFKTLIDKGVINKTSWKKAKWSVIGGIKHYSRKGTSFSNYSDKDTVITMLTMFKEGWYNLSVNSGSSPVLAAINLGKEDNYLTAFNKIKNLALAEYTRMNSEKPKGFKSYSPESYGFFPYLPINSAPDYSLIEKDLNDQITELKTTLENLNLIENGKLTFDKSLDIDSFLRDFIYNFNLKEAEMILMMQGDPNFYKNTDDFFKRAREVWSPGNFVDTKASFTTKAGKVIKFPENGKYKLKIKKDVEIEAPQKKEFYDNLNKIFGQSEADRIANRYNNVNLTDAQSYIDLYSYRLRLIGERKWTDNMQEAYDLLIVGSHTNQATFQPIKPFYYTQQIIAELVAPMQNKDSEFLLIPAFAEGNPELEEFLIDFGYSKIDGQWSFDEIGRDEGKYTDKISFESAIKIGLSSPYVGENLSEIEPIQMNWADWRRQMETPEHHLDSDSRFATQIMKLITADLTDDAKFPDGRTGKDIKDEYERLVIADIVRSSEQLKERFYNEGDTTKVKEGVEDVFESNSELASIGSIEQYSQYLDTIFPDRKVKDIVYHGSPSGKITSFDSKKTNLGAFYFTPYIEYAKSYTGKNGDITPVILNATKLKYIDSAYAASKFNKESNDAFIADIINPEKIKLVSYGEEDVIKVFNTQKQAKEFQETNSGWEQANTRDIDKAIKFLLEDYDSIETNIEGTNKGIFSVFEPEQIHILGSKQDIEGFEEFVKNNKQGERKINKAKFIDILKEEVVKRQLGDQYLDALALVEGDTALPLFHPLHSTRIEAMISAIFKNNVTKQKFLTGVALYNVSAYGLERKPKIVFNKDGGIDHLECYAPVYNSYLEKYRLADGTIDIEAIKNPETGEPELLEGLVYRIPTEDKYSMFNVKIIGFIPGAVGGAIVLPTEITEIAGLDFDIDKTYGFFYSKGNEDTAKQESDNAKLKLMKSILQHPSMVKSFLDPGGFNTISSLVKKIKEVKGIGANNRAPNNPNAIIEATRRINTGSALTGIAANYNAAKARWQNYPMTLKKGFVFDDQTYDNLSQVLEIDKYQTKNPKDRNVSRNIAEVLASAVDNGKTPLAEFYNLNSYTADVGMSMLTTGVPLRTVMFFLAQPSIVEYTNAYFNNNQTEVDSGLAPIETPHSLSTGDLFKGLAGEDQLQQDEVLQNFIYYKKIVTPVADLIMATKTPDSGAGPSIAETVNKQRVFYKNLEPKITGSKAFIKSQSFHTTFVQKGIDEALKTFEDLGFPNFTFGSGLKLVLDNLAGIKGSELSVKETDDAYKNYMEYLSSRSTFFNSLNAKELHKNLADRVTEAKNLSINNMFLDRLEVKDKVINFRAVVSIHKEEFDDYRQSWAEMLKDQTEIKTGYTVSDLAVDLIKYSFLRSGFTPSGFGNFAHLQPIEFYLDHPEGQSYNKMIKQEVVAQNSMADKQAYLEFVDQYVRNNFKRIYYIQEANEDDVVKNKEGELIGLRIEAEDLPDYMKFEDTLFKNVLGVYRPYPRLGIYQGANQVMKEYNFGEQMESQVEPKPINSTIEDNHPKQVEVKSLGAPIESTTTQELEEQISSLWLNYVDKMKEKNPNLTFDQFKQSVDKHGIEYITDYLKKCY